MILAAKFSRQYTQSLPPLPIRVEPRFAHFTAAFPLFEPRFPALSCSAENTMSPRAKILSSETLFHGRVFDVRREQVQEPNGVEAAREFVAHNGSVVVLPVFDDGRMLLVRQYRHSVGGYLWELVAGRMEPDEQPLPGAKRELLEETGYTARRWEKILDVFPTPGFVSERMVVFVARDLRAGVAHPEEDERITIKAFPPHKLERWIRTGKLRDAKSVAGILYYLRFCAAKPRRSKTKRR
jgi:ADP-ribose pyrophosphatase